MPSLSLYASYIKEREEFQIVMHEHGFATYKIMGEEVYLRDLYVSPGARMNNVANDLADEICAIARRSGCKYLSGTVSLLANGATASMMVLAHYGMHAVLAKDNTVYYRKDL